MLELCCYLTLFSALQNGPVRIGLLGINAYSQSRQICLPEIENKLTSIMPSLIGPELQNLHLLFNDITENKVHLSLASKNESK